MTPSQRSQRARIAAYAMHAKHDPHQTTRAGREAFSAHFIDQVDPDGSLRREQPNEAMRRAEAARNEYYARLAYLSNRARSERKKKPAGSQSRGLPETAGAGHTAAREEGRSERHSQT